MIQFECILARLTDAVDAPRFASGGAEAVLRNVFDSASNGDIQLTIDSSRVTQPLGRQRGFWALDLHLAVGALTKNPPPPQPSRRVAVLFTDFYQPFPSALGIMFDRGFDPGDDPSSAQQFRRSPREGCAVFLKAIKDLRETPARIESESLFTTIHEMGHLFNLQHANKPLNFMAQSVASGPYRQDAYQFLPTDQLMLASCSKSAHVWPGGERFGGVSPFDNMSLPLRSRAGVPFGLDLRVDMAQREFWPFEPVELDLELRVASGVRRSFRVPHSMDAGYDTFQIWIQEPNRERRSYRSPQKYCGATQTLDIRPGNPFRRDVSIFGESGGFTFRGSGVHKIWAEFTLKSGQIVVSNVLEACVRPASRSQEYRACREVLTYPAVAKLLYHRRGHRTLHRDVATLREFCASRPKLDSLGSMRYALARALLARSAHLGRKGLVEVNGLLQTAFDSPTIGGHQRELAANLLEQLPRAGRKAWIP